VDILIFKRLRESSGEMEPSGEKDAATLDNLKNGCIPIYDFEIMQLNHDRNFPEKGVLNLEFTGGKE